MTSEFLLALYLAGFGVLTSVIVIVIPYIFAPKKPNPIKESTFECGQVPVGEARVSLMMQYYAYLLMFVVCDVMVMFLFAWAVAYLNVGIHTSLYIIVFLGLILVPIVYALRLAGKRELWW